MNETQTAQEIELSDFFLGPWAFSTEYFSGKIILGLGGDVSESESIPEEDCFFLKDFFEEKYHIFKPKKIFHLLKEDLLAILKKTSPSTFSSQGTSDELYQKDFKELKNHLDSNFKKAVLISREEFITQENTSELISNLLRKCFLFESGNPYGLWDKNFGIIGNTPEFLYAIKDSRLFTHALAGSAKIEDKEILLSSKKDQLEHEFVISDLKEKLNHFTTSLLVKPTELTPFKRMVHLKTPIEAQLKPDWTHQLLVSTLSPTAALGGYPSEVAKNFLQNSHYKKVNPKRFFGSAFGFKSKTINQVMVAIRCVQWDGQKLWIESGGGVVLQSTEEKELQEIRLKRDIIKEHYLCNSP